jgi:hypothetical protein
MQQAGKRKVRELCKNRDRETRDTEWHLTKQMLTKSHWFSVVTGCVWVKPSELR